MLRLASVLSIIICVLCVLPAHAGVKWDFEDGTLQGWTIVSGDAGPQPVDKNDDRFGGNFNKEGKYFIGTYENMKDDAEVEYRSPDFTISASTMTLLVGGGAHVDRTFVALYLASDNTELFHETGTNSESMQRKYWDVSKYKGKAVYMRIFDRERGGWGHINVDDIRELTPQEEARIEAQKKQREADNLRWLADLMKPDKRKVYSGRELTDLAMPLGGIGAGNIAVCGDGSLREWQIFNKVNSACNPLMGFFAIWAKQGNKPPVARILQAAPVEDLPTIDSTEFIGEFPIAEVIYKDDKLPVDVRMEAYSPFIPLNSKDSGIPGIVFSFKVKNPSAVPVSVSLAASLQNAVNYDGGSPIDGVRFKGYGGNGNAALRGKAYTAITMSNPGLPKDVHQFGTMTLAALTSEATAKPQFDLPAIFWNDFSKDGDLGHGATGPSMKGRTWNGALAVPIELKAGETKTVTYLITWSFPNFYADYQENLAKYRIGRNYTNYFKDSGAAAKYLAENIGRLSKETRLFRDTFFDSTLPYWFTQRIGAPAATLTSQTMLWIEDGTFAGFEGSGHGGCCPMNCTHVYDYEMALAYLFPDLERNMRHTDLKVQQMDTGAVHHRTVLPLNLPRSSGPFVDGQIGTILKSYREYRMSPDRKWFDDMWANIKLGMDFVIRDWDPNSDGVLVNEQWNTYDAAMYGPNTFIGTMYLGALRASEEMAKVARDTDSAVRYRSIFETGSKRLDSVLWNGEYYIHIDQKPTVKELESKSSPDTSIAAAPELDSCPNTPSLSAVGLGACCSAAVTSAVELLSRAVTPPAVTEAWIAEDWPKENPGANRPYGIGCHSDQLLGQWWADILDLGYLLPQDRVRTTLDSIMKYNWRWDFENVPQQRIFALKGDKGLLNCTWPNGGRPAQMTLYSDEAWTGIEYEVAGLLLYEGKIRDGYMIARAVDDRYNGVPNPPFKRNPWNEIECGEHYARAMSSWSMLTGAQGFTYCGPQGEIGFDPRISPENHRSFFSAAEGWGTFTQKRTAKSQTDTIELKYGRLTLNTLAFTLAETPEKWEYSVKIGSRSLVSTCRLIDGRMTITLKQPIYLGAGEKLTVEAKW